MNAITTDDRLGIDDLGFITVPEPGSAFLGCVALSMLAARRTRKA